MSHCQLWCHFMVSSFLQCPHSPSLLCRSVGVAPELTHILSDTFWVILLLVTPKQEVLLHMIIPKCTYYSGRLRKVLGVRQKYLLENGKVLSSCSLFGCYISQVSTENHFKEHLIELSAFCLWNDLQDSALKRLILRIMSSVGTHHVMTEWLKLHLKH